jgi:hypothetical protein
MKNGLPSQEQAVIEAKHSAFSLDVLDECTL